jgi:hypothetical protein
LTSHGPADFDHHRAVGTTLSTVADQAAGGRVDHDGRHDADRLAAIAALTVTGDRRTCTQLRSCFRQVAE